MDDNKPGYIKLQPVSPSVMKDLRNIKAYTGVTMSRFIKSRLPEIVENYYQKFPSQRPED